MKTCPQCGRTFSDFVQQCPACGIDLAVSASGKKSSTINSNVQTPPPTSNSSNQSQPTPTINPAKKTGDSSIRGQVIDAEQKSGWYNQWIGTILGVIGLFVLLYESVDFGVILGIVGIIAGLPSSNKANKTASIILGIICIIITLDFYI